MISIQSLYLRIRTYKIGKMQTKNSQLLDYLPVIKMMFVNIWKMTEKF